MTLTDTEWATALGEHANLVAPTIDVDISGSLKRGRRLRVARRLSRAGLTTAAVAAVALAAGPVIHSFTPREVPASPETTWTAPAWFAEQAQARKEMAAKIQACMNAKGWTVTMDEYGGTDTPFTNQTDLRRFETDSTDCQVASGRDLSARSQADLRQEYQRATDTWRCLKHEGFKPADPPTMDAYVASRLSGDQATVWSPYADPAVQPLVTSLSVEGLDELERVCPQDYS